MKTIYIDSDFKCHATNPDGTLREVETDFFDDKCAAFIEGYILVPTGEAWKRADGVVFKGEMIAPYKPYNILAAAQAQYDYDQAALAAAYQEGVNSI
jgi:hypothetical protein